MKLLQIFTYIAVVTGAKRNRYVRTLSGGGPGENSGGGKGPPPPCMGINRLYSKLRENKEKLRDLLTKEHRTIDGTNNNLANPNWGAVGSPLIRMVSPDQISTKDRPNPRSISNKVSHQNETKGNGKNISDLFWQWGQFLDHDITLTHANGNASNIDVLDTDDPFGTGSTIAFSKSDTDINGDQINVITSYIDGSNVYSSDEDRESALRGDGALLKTSEEGNYLPFNEEFLPNAPHTSSEFFLAGDERANEQIGLTAMHTIFVREHNLLASFFRDELFNETEASSDEIYQLTRTIIGAYMQSITFREFLPLLIGDGEIPAYQGYNQNVNAGIFNEFSTAAYRVGHTLLSSKIKCMDQDGASSDVSLIDVFFNPDAFQEVCSLDKILMGLAAQESQDVDVYVIDEARNFLFNNTFHDLHLDLVALNIQRGRDHNLPTLNEIRHELGLGKHQSYGDVTSDPEMRSRLRSAYGVQNVDDIDLFVGGLAEDHVSNGAMVGETFQKIIARQFEQLRDGDRFYYKNDLPEDLFRLIEAQRLSCVIKRNTDMNMTLMKPHAMKKAWV